MPTTDPFTTVHNALWVALIASPSWVTLVKPGNRIDVTDTSGQVRKQTRLAPADFADFEIEQGNCDMRTVSSRSARFIQEYRCFISSGLKKIVLSNQVKFETFKALFAAGDDLGLGSLVVGWNITSAPDSYEGMQPHGGKEGYGAVLSINVEMNIDRSTLHN